MRVFRLCVFFFSSRRRHTRYWRDWSSDVCSSDLREAGAGRFTTVGADRAPETRGLIAACAGGVENLRTGLVEPLINGGHQVAITLTPTAAAWLDHLGAVEEMETLTGLPGRSTSRKLAISPTRPIRPTRAENLVGRRHSACRPRSVHGSG